MLLRELLLKILKNPKRINEKQRQLLLEEIKQDFGSQGEEYLNQFLDALQTGKTISFAPYSNSVAYEDYYNHELYQTLLPLCQLIYLYEENGIAKEHAFKLATLFNSAHHALEYLYGYTTSNQLSQYPLHDACLFHLPPAQDCSFTDWKTLANQKKPTLLMLSARFQELLPHAKELTAIIQQAIENNPDKKFDKKIIEEKKKEIAQYDKAYKHLKTMPMRDATETEKNDRQEKLKQLSQQRLNLQIELAQLCEGLPLKETDLPILQAFYQRYQQQGNEAHRLLVQHGIDEKNIRLFFSLERTNDDWAIPNILVDGTEIGYPGYYLKKLDTLSGKGAALAACLGKITPCCQYLGGIGHACVIHGITSPFGGFYVVCKGDASNPTLDDKILASAWTWRSQTKKALCADSIEAKRTANVTLIAELFRYLGHQLCLNPNFSHYNVKQFNTGNKSGITKQVGLQGYPTQTVNTLDYTGYSDAYAQFRLATQTMPYLFYGKVTSDLFQEQIEKDSRAFFEQTINHEAPFKTNEPLKQAVAFALQTKQDSLIELITDIATSIKRDQELLELIGANRNYLQQLNQKKVDFSLFEKGAYLNTMNDEGMTALHVATLAGDSEAVANLIALGADLDVQDKQGNTALIYALDQVLYQNKQQIGRTIAEQLIANQASVNIKDRKETTPLLFAVLYNDLEMVKLIVEQGANLEIPDANLQTALYWAAEVGAAAIFNYLLKKNAQVNIVNYDKEDSLLIKAVEAGHLAIVKELLSHQDIIIQHQNKLGENFLHKAAANPEMLQLIFSSLTLPQRIKMVKMTTHNNNTVLQRAANYPQSLQIILQALPETERFNALRIADKKVGLTVLHRIDFEQMTAPLSMQIILQALSESDRVKLVKIPNFDGDTALHYSADNPQTLRVIIQALPESELVKLVKIPNLDGDTALHYSANYPQPLQTILDAIPQSKRLELVKMANKEGKTVLEESTTNSQALQIILQALPEAERFEAITTKNEAGKIVLNKAIYNSQLGEIILPLLPEHDRFSLFQIPGVCDYLIAVKNLIPILDSFALDYLKIYAVIKKHTTPLNNSFFSQSTHEASALAFKNIFNSSEDFEAVKKNVFNYLAQNFDTMIAQDIIKQLLLNPDEKDVLEKLQKRWDLSSNFSHQVN